MRIGIIDIYGCFLSWAARLCDEGNDVRLHPYRDPKEPTDELSHAGDGIVPKEDSFKRLVSWVKEESDAGRPALLLWSGSGDGVRADAAAALGIPVIGAGSFCDRLEKDRVFGQRVAAAGGLEPPPFREFHGLPEALEMAKDGIFAGGSYVKTDSFLGSDETHHAENREGLEQYLNDLAERAPMRTKGIIQKEIDGVAISTSRWWNGRSFVGPFEGIIEHKHFLNDDLGPMTGCSFNAVWFYDRESPWGMPEKAGFNRLTPEFLRRGAPPGLYDINAIVDGSGKAYFLEWCGRMGHDSEETSQRLISNLGNALWGVASGVGGSPVDTERVAYSVRVSAPPYPWDYVKYSDKHNGIGRRIDGIDGIWDGRFIGYGVRYNEDQDRYETATTDGLAGLSLAVSRSLERAHARSMDYAKKYLKLKGKQFRTDGLERIREDVGRLRSSGVYLPQALSR